MVDNNAAGIFTLSFNNAKYFTMQTHPSALQVSVKSSSQSVQGLTDVITYKSSAGSTMKTISVTGYFTAIAPAEADVALTGTAGIQTAAILSALNLAGSSELISAAANSISLVAGTIDLAAGLVLGPSNLVNPLTPTDAFTKLKILDEALKESIPCTVGWDVDDNIDPKQKYVVSSMNISAARIQEETGNTLEMTVSMSLSKYGIGVSVI